MPLHSYHLTAIVAFCCFWLLGCSQRADDVDATIDTSEVSQQKPQTLEQSMGKATQSKDGLGEDELGEDEYPALHNLLQLSNKMYSGGEPHSDEAFANLAKLGVRTVVSVDGAQPDVEAARKYGLRYVHIPIGYDGVDKVAGLSLARLVRDAEGPFYIHCHHGRHRGPAAAAVACIASGVIDDQEALNILERAGTSKSYAGLWRDVKTFQAPGDGVDLPKLVETADVGSFAAAMAKIDRAYDNLKLCQEANWSTPNDHPDLVPVHEALLLKEGLRESNRNLADEFGKEFQRWMTEAEAVAQDLEDSFKSGNSADDASRHIRALKTSCDQCHKQYRN